MRLRFRNVLFITVTLFAVIAPGNNSLAKEYLTPVLSLLFFDDTVTAEQAAITAIADYAEQGLPVPTVLTYATAGVTGVTQANLAQVNQHILSLSREQVDSREELQAIVDTFAAANALDQYFYYSTQGPISWSTTISLTHKHPGTALQMRDARFVISGFEAHTLHTYSCTNTSWIAPTLSHETDPVTGDLLTILDLNYGDDDWLDTKLGEEASPAATCTINVGSTRIKDSNGLPLPGSAIRLVAFVPGRNQVTPVDGAAALPNRADPVDLRVQGWPATLAMGSVTDNSYGLNAQFAAAKLDAVFKYEGDGFGDRGEVIEPSVTSQTITQARGIEAISGKKVMPTMVVYTANGSGGGVAPEDILDYSNLRMHFQNTIRMCAVMQSNKDTEYPHPASIVLDADLFGEWQKNKENGSFTSTYGDGEATPWVDIAIKQAMLEAIDLEAGYQVTNIHNHSALLSALYNLAAIKAEINSGVIEDTIKGWVQSQNFIIKRFSPDVSFGWVINLWNPGSANWVHNNYSGLQAVWDDASGSVARFVEWIGAYEENAYRPDFLTFDKYERDGFSPAGKPNYAFGAKEWDNYLIYVKQITDYLDTPAMIWQIPGGHMATIAEDIGTYDLIAHSASGGTYFMGDTAVGRNINTIRSEVLDIALGPAVYDGAANVRELLLQSPDHDWGQNRLREAAYSNVFAILWGGGETTGAVPISTNGSGDNNWLKDRIVAYQDAAVPLYHVAPGSNSGALTTIDSLNSELQGLGTTMDSSVLLYQTPDLQWEPSSIYKWDDFLAALSVMHNEGVAGVKYWLIDETLPEASNILYAKVAIAAFLAQSMQETIQYNACDENNWARTVYGAPTDYPMSASCGQLGQKYADYGMVNGVDNPYSCPGNPKMEITAITNAKWYGAPAPLFTAPDAVLEEYGLLVNGNVGRWNHTGHCMNIPGPDDVSSAQVYLRDECSVYEGQKAGSFIWDGSSVESLEGCGWWGRGVIQTTGRTNFGKLNHFIGRSHVDSADYGRTIRDVAVVAPPADPLYADMDLCSNPEFICSSTEHEELKWIAGLFFWMNEVQGYSSQVAPYAGWNYHEQLRQYVDGGLQGTGFIDAVSGIVNRGCPATTCPGSGAVDGLLNRRANFVKVLQAMGLSPQ